MNIHARQDRLSFETRVQQDERLTGQHIRTLLYTQNLNCENEKLKLRVSELELKLTKAENYCALEREVEELKKKLLECEFLHDLGRECKQRLQQMREKCLRQVDDSNAFLAARHKDELMKVVSEKLESENTWQEEKQKLIEELESHKKTIDKQKDQISSLEATVTKNNNLSAMLIEEEDKIQSLENSNTSLKREKEEIERRLKQVDVEKSSLKAELEKLIMRRNILEVQVKKIERTALELSMTKETDQMAELQQLHIASLQEKNCKISKKNEELERVQKEQQEAMKALELNLQDSTKTIKLLYKDRDLLKNRISILLNENAVQKVQEPEISATFSDFVELKRAYNSLRDEHDALLAKCSSNSIVLPSLTGDFTTVRRHLRSRRSKEHSSVPNLRSKSRD